MTWFGNLKASGKIGLGFAAITLVMCVVGWLDVAGIGQVASYVDTIVHRDLPVSVDIQRVDSLANVMSRDLRQAMLVPTDARAVRERVTRYDEEVRRLIDGMAGKLVAPEGKAALQAMRAAYEPIRAASFSIIDHTLEGDIARAMAETEHAKADKTRLTEAIAALAQTTKKVSSIRPQRTQSRPSSALDRSRSQPSFLAFCSEPRRRWPSVGPSPIRSSARGTRSAS